MQWLRATECLGRKHLSRYSARDATFFVMAIMVFLLFVGVATRDADMTHKINSDTLDPSTKLPIQDNCPKNLKQLPYRITEASCTQEIPPRKTDSLSLISEDKFLDSNEERELEELQEHPKSHITVNANADFTNESVREETEEDSESKSTNSYLDMYFETFGSFLEFGNYFFSPFITMMLENNPWKLWSSMTSFILAPKGAVQVIIAISIVLFMVLCTLALLRRIFKQRSAEKLYESVEWLNLWWSVHPPKFGRERFESVLAHALNNELQPSGHTLGSVQKPIKVLSVSLDNCPLPKLSNIRCFEADIKKNGETSQMFLTCDIEWSMDEDHSATLEVLLPPQTRIRTLLTSLKAKAFFTVTHTTQPVGSMSLKDVECVKLSSVSTSSSASKSTDATIHPINTRLVNTIKTFMTTPKSLQWHLEESHKDQNGSASLVNQVVGGGTNRAPHRIASQNSNSIGDLVSQLRDGGTVHINLAIISGEELVLSAESVTVSCTVTVHGPSQEFSTRFAVVQRNECIIRDETILSLNSSSSLVFELFEQGGTTSSIGTASITAPDFLEEGSRVQTITLRGRLAKTEIPKGFLNIQWRPAKPSEIANQSIVSHSSPMSNRKNFGPQTSSPLAHNRSGPPQLGSFGGNETEINVTHLQFATPPHGRGHSRLDKSALARLDMASPAISRSETPSVISGGSSVSNVSHGVGWAIPGRQPVILIETTHSYGTHLAVENVNAVPQHIARWKGKTRRLYVMNGHAFTASKAASSQERCAVTNKRLSKTLSRKCYRCKYCGMAVEKPQIWRVDQPCDRSQLPDMTYGTFSQGHLSTTVSGQMGVVGE
eukprot:gene4582-6773_t